MTDEAPNRGSMGDQAAGSGAGPRSQGAGLRSEREEEPLRRLQERLGRATEAAERLISEARRGGGGVKPPPAGWQLPRQQPRGAPELEALLGALGALRELVPPEVADRLLSAIRELLLAIRALIDYWLERLERRSPRPAEVQDIPIE